MTLDYLDQAFVDAWQSRTGDATDPRELAVPVAQAPAAPAPQVSAAPAAPLEGIEGDGLIDQLLHRGHAQWAGLADEIEAARLAGHRVIAITGGERGEGRSTLAVCLARTLRARGREVVLLAQGDPVSGDSGEPADGGRLHDKRIVLVDAGIWFPPGPVRRQRLAVASLGCDAVILVRRTDRPPVPAWVAALAAVGVAVLGEVLTFAPPAGSSPETDESNAAQETVS